ncbi:36412_t:CDS:2, partial [Gigaspora margarita]
FTQIAIEKRQNSKTVELINQISQTSDNIPPSSTPQLYNPQTTTFNSSIYTPSSAISTSTPLTQFIVLPTQSLANPLSNINTNKTFQTSQTQLSVKHTYFSKLKSQTNPLSSTLGHLLQLKLYNTLQWI